RNRERHCGGSRRNGEVEIDAGQSPSIHADQGAWARRPAGALLCMWPTERMWIWLLPVRRRVAAECAPRRHSRRGCRTELVCALSLLCPDELLERAAAGARPA